MDNCYQLLAHLQGQNDIPPVFYHPAFKKMFSSKLMKITYILKIRAVPSCLFYHCSERPEVENSQSFKGRIEWLHFFPGLATQISLKSFCLGLSQIFSKEVIHSYPMDFLFYVILQSMLTKLGTVVEADLRLGYTTSQSFHDRSQDAFVAFCP